jgi:hypothetical protein
MLGELKADIIVTDLKKNKNKNKNKNTKKNKKIKNK